MNILYKGKIENDSEWYFIDVFDCRRLGKTNNYLSFVYNF